MGAAGVRRACRLCGDEEAETWSGYARRIALLYDLKIVRLLLLLLLFFRRRGLPGVFPPALGGGHVSFSRPASNDSAFLLPDRRSSPLRGAPTGVRLDAISAVQFLHSFHVTLFAGVRLR